MNSITREEALQDLETKLKSFKNSLYRAKRLWHRDFH